MVGVRVAADSFQLQLGAGEQLERIVVKRAREAPPRLVATSLEVVGEDEALDDPLALGSESQPQVMHWGVVREAVRRRLEAQRAPRPKAPEGGSAGADLLGDRGAQAAEEGR